MFLDLSIGTMSQIAAAAAVAVVVMQDDKEQKKANSFPDALSSRELLLRKAKLGAKVRVAIT